MKVCNKCNTEKHENDFCICVDCYIKYLMYFEKLNANRRKLYSKSENVRNSSLKRSAKRDVNARENISDHYVIDQLRHAGLTTEFIKSHPELIEFKRVQILLHRIKKELKKQ